MPPEKYVPSPSPKENLDEPQVRVVIPFSWWGTDLGIRHHSSHETGGNVSWGLWGKVFSVSTTHKERQRCAAPGHVLSGDA